MSKALKSISQPAKEVFCNDDQDELYRIRKKLEVIILAVNGMENCGGLHTEKLDVEGIWVIIDEIQGSLKSIADKKLP